MPICHRLQPAPGDGASEGGAALTALALVSSLDRELCGGDSMGRCDTDTQVGQRSSDAHVANQLVGNVSAVAPGACASIMAA